MAMGGTETAWAATPLGAMAANPAGLASSRQPRTRPRCLRRARRWPFQQAGSGGDLDSSFLRSRNLLLGMPLHTSVPVTLGLSLVLQSTLLANWKYVDPAGGLGGSLWPAKRSTGDRRPPLRAWCGRADQPPNSRASVGLVYNENHLKTPYIFQNMNVNPGLNGAKTLLNLNTSGFGWDIQVGAIFRATTNLQFGLSYKTESTIHTDGRRQRRCLRPVRQLRPARLYVFSISMMPRSAPTFSRRKSAPVCLGSSIPNGGSHSRSIGLNWGGCLQILFHVSLK